MSAGIIPRSDLKLAFKIERVVLGYDQLQQSFYNSNIDNLLPLDFPNDIAAKAGGVAIGCLYHNAGVVRVRLT